MPHGDFSDMAGFTCAGLGLVSIFAPDRWFSVEHRPLAEADLGLSSDGSAFGGRAELVRLMDGGSSLLLSHPRQVMCRPAHWRPSFSAMQK